MGRFRQLDKDKKVTELYNQGLTDKEIGYKLGVTSSAIHYRRKQLGLEAHKWKRTGPKPVVMDGIKMVENCELQSFLGQLTGRGGSFGITVPKALCKKRGYKLGDKLIVAVKKATKEEVGEYTQKN